MPVLMIAIGAALGVLGRVLVSGWINKRWSGAFPLATFTVNMLGSLLLGFVTGLTMSHELSLMLSGGFMGSFTTFSTLHVENVDLLRKKQYKHLLAYIVTTYGLGICLIMTGIYIANQIMV